MTMRKSTQQIMIDWMKNFLVDYPIPPLTPFPGSMQDGKVFCYLVHKTDPSLIDISNVDSRSPLENIKIAFTAGSKIGIPPLLDAEDVIQAPDNHSILTYLSFYRQKAKGDGMLGGGAKSAAPVAAVAATPSAGGAPKAKTNFAYGGAIKAPPKSFAGGGIKALAKAPASLEVPKAAEPVKSPVHHTTTTAVTETSEVHLSVTSNASETTKTVATTHHQETVKVEAAGGNKEATEIKTHVAEAKVETVPVSPPSPSLPAPVSHASATPKASVHVPAPVSHASATPKAFVVPSSPKSSHQASTTTTTTATATATKVVSTPVSPKPSTTHTLPTTSVSSSNSSSAATQSKIKGLTGKFESPTSSPTTTKLRVTTNNSSTLSSKTSVSSTSPTSPTSPTKTTSSFKSTTTSTSKTTTTTSLKK